MSWSKVKTLLIILFAFVNIFLAYNLYFKSGTASEVSAQTVESTVKVLERNNVGISPSIINRKNKKIKKIEILNSIDTHSTLAKNLLENCTKTSDGYKGDAGEIKFKGVEFEYIHKEKRERLNINDNNAVDLAIKLLNEKGFEVKSSDIRDFKKNSQCYTLKFGKNVDSLPVYESSLVIKIENAGYLLSIEGYWPEVKKIRSDTKIEAVSETTVLINLITAPGFETKNENEVVDIQLGYTLGGQPESETPILLTPLPAYRIILKNGENYIFDAKTGEFVYKY